MGSTTVRISEGAARELKDSLARAVEQVDASTATTSTVPSAGYRVTLPGDDDDSGGPKVH